jgi:hypothetical protein
MTNESADTKSQPLAPPIEGVGEPITDLSPTGVEESLIHTNEVDGDAQPKALQANELEGIYLTGSKRQTEDQKETTGRESNSQQPHPTRKEDKTQIQEGNSNKNSNKTKTNLPKVSSENLQSSKSSPKTKSTSSKQTSSTSEETTPSKSLTEISSKPSKTQTLAPLAKGQREEKKREELIEQPSSASKGLVEQQPIQQNKEQPDAEAEADTEGEEEIVDDDLTTKEVEQARSQLDEAGAEPLLEVRKPRTNEVLTTRWTELAEARFAPTELTATSGVLDNQIVGEPLDLFEDLQRWVRGKIEKLAKENRHHNLRAKWKFLETVLTGHGELDEKQFQANYPNEDLTWMNSDRMKDQCILHMMEQYLVQTPRAKRTNCPDLVDLTSTGWQKFKRLIKEDGTRTNEFSVPLIVAFIASGRLSIKGEDHGITPSQRKRMLNLACTWRNLSPFGQEAWKGYQGTRVRHVVQRRFFESLWYYRSAVECVELSNREEEIKSNVTYSGSLQDGEVGMCLTHKMAPESDPKRIMPYLRSRVMLLAVSGPPEQDGHLGQVIGLPLLEGYQADEKAVYLETSEENETIFDQLSHKLSVPSWEGKDWKKPEAQTTTRNAKDLADQLNGRERSNERGDHTPSPKSARGKNPSRKSRQRQSQDQRPKQKKRKKMGKRYLKDIPQEELQEQSRLLMEEKKRRQAREKAKVGA